MTTLITGGCGYIGSHVVKQLSESGHKDLIVLDNLSTGFPEALLHNETLLKHDLVDTQKLESILKDNSIKSIIHFAASIVVPESVSNPIKYYSNNTLNTLNLLKASVNAGVENFIFQARLPFMEYPIQESLFEETTTQPINPYGWSKLMTEQIIQDIAAVHKLKFCILRYFNVAGADSQSRIGQRTPNATHLIKVACQAGTGERDSVSIFGTDYPTPDGTAIRDYIHVDDLASAHLLALSALEAGADSDVFNVGYGRGSSVREVIEQVKKVSGKDFKVIESPRRTGDPPNLIAQSDKIRNKLKWKPQFDNLETIVRDAWNWEQKLMTETSNPEKALMI